MANIAQLEEILQTMESADGIDNAVIVSRSGMHIAGKVPNGAHTETFVAMSAILLGAAETATTEIKDNLDYVTISLIHSRIFIKTISSRGILVLKIKKDAPVDNIIGLIGNYIGNLESAL